MPASNSTRAALIVIDVQASFAQMPFWPHGQHEPFQQALLRLDAACRVRGVPVVHIFHVGQGGPFRVDSGFVTPLPWLPGAPAVRFDKHTHNAFTDTGLDLWLRRQGVQRLIISGIRTEQCCETTARVGADIGYAVDFVSEATLTFPMTHARSGRVFSAEDIVARTELVLAERFARIVTVDECTQHLDHPA